MGPGHAALSVHSANLTIRLRAPCHPIQPDDKTCQTQFIESALQRRERIAFLKRRECARRVAIWMHETGFVDTKTPPRCDPYAMPLSWERPDQYDRENEPYIIYSSSPSPRTPLSPVQTLPTNASPSSPRTPPARCPPLIPKVRVSPRPLSSTPTKRHRRIISLSSISELPEED